MSKNEALKAMSEQELRTELLLLSAAANRSTFSTHFQENMLTRKRLKQLMREYNRRTRIQGHRAQTA